MSTQAALKSLFELRAVLDRMGENDSTLREAIGHDIERAVRLTNAAVAQLTQGERGAADPADGPDTDDEEDE